MLTNGCKLVCTILILLLAGCGNGGGDNSGGDGAKGTVHNGIFETYPGGISRLSFNGRDLLGSTGGYYIIGTCPGYSDDPAINFTSFEVYGKSLNPVTNEMEYMLNAPSPDKCPSSPFFFIFNERAPNILEIQSFIGPMAADASTVSVPFDLDKNLFDRFRISGDRYYVGGCSAPRLRLGSEARYDSIPLDCYIRTPTMDVGPVGVAFTKGTVLWGEVVSPYATVNRRLIDGGNLKGLKFYRHPHTHNIEWSFGPVKKGETVYFVEEISVY